MGEVMFYSHSANLKQRKHIYVKTTQHKTKCIKEYVIIIINMI